MEQTSTPSAFIRRQPNQASHHQANKISALSPETPQTTYNFNSYQSSKNSSSSNVMDPFVQKNRPIHTEDLDIKPLISSPSNSLQSTRARSGSAKLKPVIIPKIISGQNTMESTENSYNTIANQGNSYIGSSYQSKNLLRIDNENDDGNMRLSHDSVFSETYDDETFNDSFNPNPNPNPSNNTVEKIKIINNENQKSQSEFTGPQSNTQHQSSQQFNGKSQYSNDSKVSQATHQTAHQEASKNNIYNSEDISFIKKNPDSPRSILIRKKAPPIKNFILGEQLGQGANGRVRSAFNSDNGEFFAVKEINFNNLSPHLLEEKIVALQREISVMKTLDHENIVRYVGANKQGTNLLIFLELVPGGSLASLVQRYGRLSEDVCKKFTKQILLGLDYLHKNRIIHRDIKGANILLNVEGLAKLADFGASRQIADLMSLTHDFQTLSGTPHFMAPEVILQTGHGRSADIWSVGCTITEICTGKPPFSEYKTAASVMYHIASTNDQPKFPDFLSSEAKDFLQRCFVRDRSLRATAEELLMHPWLKNVITPLEAKLISIGHPMSAPEINNLIIKLQEEEKALQSSDQSQRTNDSTKDQSSASSSNNQTPSSSNQTPRTITPPTSTKSSHPRTKTSDSFPSSPKSTKSEINSIQGEEDILTPHVANSIDFKQVKKLRQDSLFNSLNFSQEDLLSAQKEPEVEVEYQSPRLGYDDQADINKYLKKKSDILNKSMKSLDLKSWNSSFSSIQNLEQEQKEEKRRLSSRRKARSNNSAYDLSVETGEEGEEEFIVHSINQHPSITSPSPSKFTPEQSNQSVTYSPAKYEESFDDKRIAMSESQKREIELENKKREEKKKKEEEQRKIYELEMLEYQKNMNEEIQIERPSSELSGKGGIPRRSGSGRKRSNSTNSNKSNKVQTPSSTSSNSSKNDSTDKKIIDKDKTKSNSKASSKSVLKPQSSEKSSKTDISSKPSSRETSKPSSRETSKPSSRETPKSSSRETPKSSIKLKNSKVKSNMTGSTTNENHILSPQTKPIARARSVLKS